MYTLQDKFRVSCFLRSASNKTSPVEKLQQNKVDYSETAKLILPKYNDQSGRGFCKKVRSFTTRLVQRRKDDEIITQKGNVRQRCQSLPSDTNSSSSFAQQ